MTQEEFLTHIIKEICDYAVENGMIPDDTLAAIADTIKGILTISSFNKWNWKVK